MPRIKSAVGNKSQSKKIVKEITCTMCAKTKKAGEFYQSFNPLHQTSKLPYCKQCIQEMSTNSDGSLNIEGFKNALKMVDRPFLYDILQISIEDKMETVGCYFKNLGLAQYRDLTWKSSVFEPQENNNINNIAYHDFQLTDEIIDKWGNGYKTDEYQAFERKYNLLKNNYPEKTSMHTEALLKYIRYSVKEELATSTNNVGEAKSWGALAKDAATAAKINPSQLSAADLQDGLSTFGQLARAVEQAVDIVEILPRFKQKPQDNVDFTLWCYINYVRGLKGLGDCDYKDIYGFYEQRKKDLENKITSNNNDTIADDDTEGDKDGEL